MKIDPFMVTTAVFGLSAISIYARSEIYRGKAAFWKHRAEAQLDRIASLHVARNKAHAELSRLKDGARRGGYATAAKRQAIINERKAVTCSMLTVAPLRPRDEVVADIRASRASRNSGADAVAAKKGG